MAGVIWRANAEKYQWGGPNDDQCDAWHLVKRDGLSVKEEHMPIWARERRHHHVYSRQFFYVLTGELMLEVEGVMHSVSAGRGIEVAPGVLHQVLNRGAGEVRFLVVSQPAADEDYVEG